MSVPGGLFKKQWDGLGRMTVIALGSIPLIAGGCLIVPTPGHGGVGVVTKEAVELLEPGKTTRADVVLRLGDPAERLEWDRFFVYKWQRIHGYFIWAVPYVTLGAAPIENAHYLALEFTVDNRLKRFKFFDPALMFGDARRGVQQWIEERTDSAKP